MFPQDRYNNEGGIPQDLVWESGYLKPPKDITYEVSPFGSDIRRPCSEIGQRFSVPNTEFEERIWQRSF